MNRNILIVEDNQHLRQILAIMLRSAGYEISQAASGAEAVKAAVSVNPSLILLDLDLPDTKGVEVARAIKNSPSGHIPIIGCSAFFGSNTREEALSAGMVDYLEKPISFERIKSKIEKFTRDDR